MNEETEEILRVPVTSSEDFECPEGDEEEEEGTESNETVKEIESDDTEEARVAKEHGYTPMQAIKEKCLDCCCFNRNEVTLCETKGCALWAFRKGRKPIKRQMTDEARAAASERFRKFRENKKLSEGK